MARSRVIVSGDVQGVYFRDTCRDAAQRHGVSGWVRNLPDRRVEAVFEGSPEQVDALVKWAHHGSPTAIVDTVDVYPEEPEGLTGFEIRRTPWQK